MESISNERIEAVLFNDGRQLSDYFLVSGTPMFWGKLGDKIYPWANLVEDDALSQACTEYLREHDVTEYVSVGEVPEPS